MTLTSEHLDVSLPAERRASALLAQLTLREKCFQLVSVPAWWLVKPDGSEPAERAEMLRAGPGSIANFGVDNPAQMSGIVGELQRTVIEGTRHGIPLLVHIEALNGVLAGGHMVFPTAIGLGATWSPDLIEEMGDLIRTQLRRVGVRQALSPNMDIALDPRWGRFHETYGEDPYLAAAMSVAFTKGLQGSDLRDGVLATAKHFIGYSSPEGGVNLSAYEGGPRRTRDLFAFTTEAAIGVANLGSVMNSYADVDGVPTAANRQILTDLLRGTLGFDGFVSSDYMTLEHMVTRQRVARTPAEAARLSIHAGLDTEFPTPYGYGDVLVGEADAGRVDISDIDRSAHRVLTAKFRLGLFENPYPQERIDLAEVVREGRELSRELAERSVVLLTNDGILPLAESGLKVAVIGPHADAVKLQFPTYTYPAFREMTVFMSSGGLGNMVGIDPGMAAWNTALFPETPVEEFVRSTLGATSLADEIASHAADTSVSAGSTLTHDLGDAELAAAVQAAREADVVVLALGGASLWFNGERTEGEGSDSADISLPAAQTRLVEAVAATGTPLVAVIFQGRPYALPRAVRDAAAIIVAPYGGPFGPAAVADVLFGRVNPSGRLPYSIPRHSGQIPVYYHKKAGTGYRNPLPPDVSELYLDMAATPEFTFGAGLSYTKFQLSQLASEASASTAGRWHVSTAVDNVGSRQGSATVQLYARVNAFGVTRPAEQLIGFARVPLAPGQSREVRFSVDATQFAFTGLDDAFAVEPCRVDFFVGFDADDRRQEGSFELEGDRRILRSLDRVFFADVTIR
jgi:beta-glucosidase